MADIKRLLELRNIMKKKKPVFIRQDAHKRKKLKKKWIRPKGLHSKMRHGFKGRHAHVSSGYSSPRLVKGLDRNGLIVNNISNAKDLDGVDTKKEGIVINSRVGAKKRLEILKKASEKGVKVLNVRDTKLAIEVIEQSFKKRLEEKQKSKEKKKEKQEEQKKKAKEKEEKKDSLVEKIETEEERLEREKKEKDKLLIKKDIK